MRSAAFYIACFGAILNVACASEGFVVKKPPKTWINYHYAASDEFHYDWKRSSRLDPSKQILTDAVYYLHEAIERMTGFSLPIRREKNIEKGIALILFLNAPDSIRNNSEIKEALKNTGEDEYNANEAFYIKTDKDRIVIVGNTTAGLSHGIVELLESVGYEVLGMGPNWTHIPDYKNKPLMFNLQSSMRPGFYLRLLLPTSGQDRGFNTMREEWVADPRDESVTKSYTRWRIGTRMAGGSMSRIRSGHALGAYHRFVVREIRRREKIIGFLSENMVCLGEDFLRPPASIDNRGTVWINTSEDEEIKPTLTGVYKSDGKEWGKRDRLIGYPMDLSVDFVRETIFEELKQQSELHFSKNPSSIFYFNADPEDGNLNYSRIGELAHNPNWYPEYLKNRGKPLGQSYVLHGVKGLDQPFEKWDPHSAADTVFGFSNWLLLEYDKWIESLPEDKQRTSAGIPKKDLLRINLLSYNYHDVPPNFNLDERIRVKIAGFPKNRGKGKWRHFRTHADMAKAYHILLPNQPSVDYQIWSQSLYHDFALQGIGGSPLAHSIQEELQSAYEAGFRGFEAEVDFNFGKFGLRYYLASKMLWNPTLSHEELNELRDRWLQRSFGPAWREMKKYFDFMAPENLQISSPQVWARAIRLLDDADRRLREFPSNSTNAYGRRIDDVKQYWYYYYLLDTGEAGEKTDRFREFMWKGQMSYMTPMVMAMRRFFDGELMLNNVVDKNLGTQPAHYTSDETMAWWEEILAHWQPMDVKHFREGVLSNGDPAGEVDLYDLVKVNFSLATSDTKNAIRYNRMPGAHLQREEATFITIAEKPGDIIGFRFYWPDTEKNHPRDVPWGLDYWDKESQRWDQIFDLTMTSESSKETMLDGKNVHLVEVGIEAPQAGSYRFFVGAGDWESELGDLNIGTENPGNSGHVYHMPMIVRPGGPRPWYFYIPKGTRRLDLETSSQEQARILRLYNSDDCGKQIVSRVLHVRDWGLQSIDLLPEEAGTVAVLEAVSFPLLYSVPQLSSKTPEQLLIPRAIAEADALLDSHDEN